MNWNSFVSTLLGALVSFGAIVFTNNLDKRKRKRDHEKLMRALLAGLNDEISGLLELTANEFDPIQKLPDGQPHETIFNISQDYFTVYHANAPLIMQIEDPALRRAIFHTYTRAKIAIDTSKANQGLLERFHYLQSTYHKTKEPAVQAACEEYRHKLVEIAAALKKVQAEFKRSAAKLVETLAEKNRPGSTI